MRSILAGATEPHKVGPPGQPTGAKRVALQHTAKEGHAMHRHYNTALTALTLVRIGQELGSDSPASRAVHDLLELLVSLASVLTR